MAYDEGLAQRIRDVLKNRTDVEEKKMFGGVAFMVRRHMACGVNGTELMGRSGGWAGAWSTQRASLPSHDRGLEAC